MRYIPPKSLEAANQSEYLYVKVKSQDMAMFRFLLEAYDNLAMFTTLEPKTTLVKILYSPHEKDRLERALLATQELVPIEIL